MAIDLDLLPQPDMGIHFHADARSAQHRLHVLSALADLGLNALGLTAAIWAVKQSGSLFASIWCFFLVQALFVAIPARLSRKPEKPDRDSEDRFQHSRQRRVGR
ncbi:MAG: hypothetical protein ACREYE_09290 [Gammaproteobacteria bacterium]